MKGGVVADGARAGVFWYAQQRLTADSINALTNWLMACCVNVMQQLLRRRQAR